jgi:hypothetical protein
MANIPSALTGKWVHSHEEDTDTQQVFRPASHQFPPSRGRRGFELRPDGSLIEGGPGPTDRTTTASGSWTSDGRELVFSSGPSGSPRRYHIESVAPNKLVLRK